MISNKEILKLHNMLTEANIPHSFDDDFFGNGTEAYIIIIERDGQMLCDAIYHYGSYGYNSGLLEIMGGLTLEEYQNDSVLGSLTAEEVFKRFNYCYENKTNVYVEIEDDKYQEYQKALDNMCCGCYGGDDGCNGKDKYCSRYLRLQELVDKETPMKVIPYTSEITNSEEAYTFYTCPKCRMLLSNEIYCPKCGQKLDWEVEDENN